MADEKRWILNAFSMSSPTHVAADYWIELAEILDGNFHALFLADMLGVYDVYKGPENIREVIPGAAQFPISDPSIPIAAMAAATRSLSFGVTASTTYESPFLLARRYATLDHLTNGRIAWNVVTSYLPSAAKNLGLEQEINHDERYAIADEFLEVVYKLLEGSWRDDAVRLDPDAMEYADPDGVRRIDHVGKYFKVAGPHLVEPSRQRTPFIFQAGASKAGKEFATKHAEAMFLPGMEIATVKRTVDDIRATARAQGRDPAGIKLLVGMLVIVDKTDEMARAKYDEYLSYADLDGTLALFGGWTGTDLGGFADDDDLKFSGPGAIQSMVSSWSAQIPGSDNLRWTKKRVAQELSLGGPHPRAVGSAQTVADTLQSWVDEADVDGFNISYAVGPGDLEDVARYLVPELKRRGVFWDAAIAEGRTTRENYLGTFSPDGRLSEDHPGSQYKWKSGK
ncbi:Flavin-dependent oxidoreductase, luciferase family [Geosmithia morbida]|uniref:Flavin-dependent oxidoreductase, luciferase family n=1 Tax=Geosmithia morbida TaxID=1094350 RepID=A0A9P4YUN8_9HYPO|nr:Flavin-dependent oxidoreductase, luciferase family [Geosmithia morbida]KAF4123120.1 Flavin-dependent oxidoreductase, luciferase family [Geosmithia morbida]